MSTTIGKIKSRELEDTNSCGVSDQKPQPFR